MLLGTYGCDPLLGPGSIAGGPPCVCNHHEPPREGTDCTYARVHNTHTGEAGTSTYIAHCAYALWIKDLMRLVTMIGGIFTWPRLLEICQNRSPYLPPPTGIGGERFSQTISNVGHAALLR
jgi:hypothetical protein